MLETENPKLKLGFSGLLGVSLVKLGFSMWYSHLHKSCQNSTEKLCRMWSSYVDVTYLLNAVKTVKIVCSAKYCFSFCKSSF